MWHFMRALNRSIKATQIRTMSRWFLKVITLNLQGKGHCPLGRQHPFIMRDQMIPILRASSLSLKPCRVAALSRHANWFAIWHTTRCGSGRIWRKIVDNMIFFFGKMKNSCGCLAIGFFLAKLEPTRVLLNKERYKRSVFVWREELLWLIERVCFCF